MRDDHLHVRLLARMDLRELLILRSESRDCQTNSGAKLAFEILFLCPFCNRVSLVGTFAERELLGLLLRTINRICLRFGRAQSHVKILLSQ